MLDIPEHRGLVRHLDPFIGVLVPNMVSCMNYLYTCSQSLVLYLPGLISDTMLSLRAAHEDLEDAQILAKAVHDELTESVDSAISTKTTKLTCCKNDLLEHISSKGFRPSLQDISWAIRSVKESAMSTVTDKTDTIISGFHDQRKSVVTDIDSRYKQLSVELVERIEKIAFHVASIESLQSYVTVLLSLNNSMEILTVYEELSTRIESVLDSTDVEKITNDLVTFVSFKVDTGILQLGGNSHCFFSVKRTSVLYINLCVPFCVN